MCLIYPASRALILKSVERKSQLKVYHKKRICFFHTLPKWWCHRGFWEQTKQFPTNGNLGNRDLPRLPLVRNCLVCFQKASVMTHFGCLGWKRMRVLSKWRLFHQLFIQLIARLGPLLFVWKIPLYALFDECRFGWCIANNKKKNNFSWSRAPICFIVSSF